MQGLPEATGLWGKFRDAEHGGPAWHPLIDHSIDVAGVLEALLRQPNVARRMARAGGIPSLDESCVARLSFLAFIHDLGKCTPGFRAKAVPELGRTAGHLAALKPLCGGPLASELQRLLVWPTLYGWAGDVLEDYLLAVFAHHGRTPDLSYVQGSDSDLLKGWQARDHEALRRLDELLVAGRQAFAAAFTEKASQLSDRPAFQHLFAGLVMLADWVGSDAERFPFSEPGDEPRVDFVRRRVPEVLIEIGFAPPTPPVPLPDFNSQFTFPPRVAQAAIDALTLPDAEGSIVLLESETGSGKTEAALRWASRLIDAGLVDGCFFAVPLRSAAVQLHERMQGWLDRTYGGSPARAGIDPPHRRGPIVSEGLPRTRGDRPATVLTLGLTTAAPPHVRGNGAKVLAGHGDLHRAVLAVAVRFWQGTSARAADAVFQFCRPGPDVRRPERRAWQRRAGDGPGL
ncbi:MAG: CRISPR-associated endonuclease Cas3'' [Defluviicoccus sp.]|nr:CRISPR-associated endonuclease Cas3'' [Defluviicoccus sp.]